MSEPFLAEIRMMSFNFPPKGWAFCNGQLIPINQNQALFSLLGTTFGGNGQTNFALPDLQGRVPVHVGNGHTLGEKAGEQNHTLTISETPSHTHQANASSSSTGAVDLPAGNVLANSAPNFLYGAAQNLTPLNTATVGSVGGSQAHQNMQPFLTINFSIALQGIFPSQT
ncbi:phage tail protein [Bradyrhizobium guangdongense]|uniref:Phage tail protein n=1 Tax=Bradyrhizobium guangdongense TaxID=1325090 RepID=A0A410V0H7_9BRAD|nr:tail fiber protein [Bradyrhizobium guangdongense]QAU37165.1 phage tail protein [Bradyrhizobium guangdongense]QOZ58220.1 phage tail protein [Bradyrhizobium guangdongense]GGI20991.1 tail Collar domain-containing protein [Bradyrhizobium guangdongense]